jgi:hypothetical protein
MDALLRQCLAERVPFAVYLKEYHASRDGYLSFCTDSIDRFRENTQGLHGEKEYERSCWQALDYLVFAGDVERSEWNGAFVEYVTKKEGNGAFEGAWVFVPQAVVV